MEYLPRYWCWGALIGLAVGQVALMIVPTADVGPPFLQWWEWRHISPLSCVRTLTGVVLIIEMTGNYEQMLPLLISCFFAYAVAEYRKDLPIYEVLLERDLLSGGEQTDLTQNPTVMDFTSRRALHSRERSRTLACFTTGCILVRCSNGRREWDSQGKYSSEANMRITAVIEPDAANGLAILRHGCEIESQKKNRLAKISRLCKSVFGWFRHRFKKWYQPDHATKERLEHGDSWFPFHAPINSHFR